MKKIFMTLWMAVLAAVSVMAQTPDPELVHVLDLKVKLGQAFGVGQVTQGNRFVIPITGGTFEGPRLRGEVLPGGADYQMQNQGRTDLEAIYCIRTDDGVSIHVRNRGIIAGNYFYCSPTFEAPLDSRYAWLNNGIYVCKPAGFMQGGIQLRVWMVRDPYNFDATIQPIPQLQDYDRVNQPATQQGRIETITYRAHRRGQTMTKRAQVYTPYGYKAKDKKTKYDVLYLMHGGGDNVASFLTPPNKWFALRNVLDHLIQEGRMRPIIVVCPTFYDDDQNIGENRMNDATTMTREFHTELQNDLIPMVENAYNTYLDGRDSLAVTRSRNHRAYGGFSMGALSTWYQLAYGVNAVRTFIPLSGDIWVYDAQGKKQDARTAAEWINGMLEKSPFAHDFQVYGYTGTKDIAGTPMKGVIEALDQYAPLFRYNTPDANLHFAMRQNGDHFYGHINEYLYLALPTIFPAK